jgi:phage terminase large subunit-like protein
MGKCLRNKFARTQIKIKQNILKFLIFNFQNREVNLMTFKPTKFMLPTSHYDKARADHAVRFIEQLKHTKGIWSGKPFKLLPWQETIVRNIFGTIKENGFRQFNTVYVEVGKKNGKSELAAAIALYMLCADGEEAAEIYGCANDRQQSCIVFNVAKDMVSQCPALLKRMKILDSTKRMIYLPTRGIYQALSTEVASKYGYNVHACIFDELLGQPNRKLFDVMTKGSGAARKQPLNFIITTAGSDKTGICREVHSKAIDILEDRKHDPTFYPVVYSAPAEADWTDPKIWRSVNPSLGETVDEEFLKLSCESAKQNPAEEMQFRQFFLCQWTSSAVRWMPMDKWDACGNLQCTMYNVQFGNKTLTILERLKIMEQSFEGRVCYGGLDLSSTIDITAFVLVFPPTNESENYGILPYFWIPEENIKRRILHDHVPYDIWNNQGFLKTTEGNVVHYGFIEKFIEDLGQKYNIREIAFDRWGAIQMTQNLENLGFAVVPFGQGFKDMSPPTKELMKLVLEEKIAHGGHPVLRRMIDNIFIRTDPAGNIKPDKEKSTEKIDGAVATIMALDRAIRHGSHIKNSIYDERGLLVI